MKHRKYGKSVLKALILGSLVTVSVPGVAGAATTAIGPVTVDGVETTTTSEGTSTTAGKDGSTVSVGQYSKKDTYSLFLVGAQTVNLQGKRIDTSGMVIADGTTIHVGGTQTL